jgi:anti-anti-sigma factor
MRYVKHEVKNEVRIIAIDEVRLVDGPAIEQCYREILEVLDATEESNALLHFGRVTFLSSAALGMLMRVHKKCKEYKMTLKLSNISPEILSVFKLTGLDKVLAIYPDASAALEAFQKAGGSFFRKKNPSSHNVN